MENPKTGFEEYIKMYLESKVFIYFLPDNYFMRKLDKNPFYPFKQLDSYLFECNYRYFISSGFYTITTVLLAFLSIINSTKLFNYKSPSSWYIIVLLIFMSIVCFLLSITSFTKRTIRLNLLQNKYEVFIQNKLIATDHLHNIYIRLIEKHILKTKLVYRLMLSGSNIDNIPISPYSYSLQLFRQLGRRLAQNLYINYFDVNDLSSKHTILNYCPFNSSKTDLWKFLIQEKDILLQKKPIYWLKPNFQSNKPSRKPHNYDEQSVILLPDIKPSLSLIEDRVNQSSDTTKTDQVDISSQELREQITKIAQHIKVVSMLTPKKS